MTRAIEDLESIRRSIGVDIWRVLGHSWGSDLGIRYALDRPDHVGGVIGLAGHGLHRDREWSAAYEAGRTDEPPIAIDRAPAVHKALFYDFKNWIHEPRLWRRLADCGVPMVFVAAGRDIRPSWPLAQLAALVPRAELMTIDGAVHDFWAIEPDRWREVCAMACAALDRL